jgi:hypothetical protein
MESLNLNLTRRKLDQDQSSSGYEGAPQVNNTSFNLPSYCVTGSIVFRRLYLPRLKIRGRLFLSSLS